MITFKYMLVKFKIILVLLFGDKKSQNVHLTGSFDFVCKLEQIPEFPVEEVRSLLPGVLFFVSLNNLII